MPHQRLNARYIPVSRAQHQRRRSHIVGSRTSALRPTNASMHNTNPEREHSLMPFSIADTRPPLEAHRKSIPIRPAPLLHTPKAAQSTSPIVTGQPIHRIVGRKEGRNTAASRWLRWMATCRAVLPAPSFAAPPCVCNPEHTNCRHPRLSRTPAKCSAVAPSPSRRRSTDVGAQTRLN